MLKRKNNKREEGSALVLTVMVLVNALLIVGAISAISVIEKKMTARAKNSAPAFQAADSGIEWVLQQISLASDPVTTTIAGVFDPDTSGMNVTTGRYDCPDGSVTAVDLNVDCQFYFIDVSGEIITDPTVVLMEIDSVRSVGNAGVPEERASRAIEVLLETSGPVAWWPFLVAEDGGNSIEDVTENMNHATLNHGDWHAQSAECFDAALSDTCIEFDGNPSDGAFHTPFNNQDFAQALDLAPIYQIENGTISFWFKADDLNHNDQGLWSKEAQEEWTSDLSIFILDNDGFYNSQYGVTMGIPGNDDDYVVIRHQENNGLAPPNDMDGDSYWVVSDNPINEGQWYFFTYTFGSGGMQLYLDGVLQSTDGTNPHSGGIDDNIYPILFGVSAISRPDQPIYAPDPLDFPFDGYMDDIRIYDYELTAAQILAMFNEEPY